MWDPIVLKIFHKVWFMTSHTGTIKFYLCLPIGFTCGLKKIQAKIRPVLEKGMMFDYQNLSDLC